MQSNNLPKETHSSNLDSPKNLPKVVSPYSDQQKKFSENINIHKPQQTLKFDTSQIKFFVDKTKSNVISLASNKLKGVSNEPNKYFPKFHLAELEKITEKVSEKVSERYSSSKSSYSKPQSQDSKEEYKITDQTISKDTDFSKKKNILNPFENPELVYRYITIYS